MGWNFIIIFFVPPHSSFYTGVRLCQQLFTDPEEASTRRDGPPSPWRISFAVPPNTPPLAKNSPKHRAKWCTKRSFPLIIVNSEGFSFFTASPCGLLKMGRGNKRRGRKAASFISASSLLLGLLCDRGIKMGWRTRQGVGRAPTPTLFFGVRGGNVAKKCSFLLLFTSFAKTSQPSFSRERRKKKRKWKEERLEIEMERSFLCGGKMKKKRRERNTFTSVSCKGGKLAKRRGNPIRGKGWISDEVSGD